MPFKVAASCVLPGDIPNYNAVVRLGLSMDFSFFPLVPHRRANGHSYPERCCKWQFWVSTHRHRLVYRHRQTDSQPLPPLLFHPPHTSKQQQKLHVLANPILLAMLPSIQTSRDRRQHINYADSSTADRRSNKYSLGRNNWPRLVRQCRATFRRQPLTNETWSNVTGSLHALLQTGTGMRSHQSSHVRVLSPPMQCFCPTFMQSLMWSA